MKLIYSLALQCDSSTSDGCGSDVWNYKLVTKNAEIDKKLQNCWILWILVLLYMLIFFPWWNEIYCHVWISHPEGLFMRLLKLLTSKSSCKLGFWKSQASLYHRQLCWQTAYTSIMLKMGVFNLRGNTLLKRFYFPLIMFIKFHAKNAVLIGVFITIFQSLWPLKAVLLLYL